MKTYKASLELPTDRVNGLMLWITEMRHPDDYATLLRLDEPEDAPRLMAALANAYAEYLKAKEKLEGAAKGLQ